MLSDHGSYSFVASVSESALTRHNRIRSLMVNTLIKSIVVSQSTLQRRSKHFVRVFIRGICHSDKLQVEFSSCTHKIT